MASSFGAHLSSVIGRRERLGTVDYRMARMDLVNQFKAGRIAEHEVCDAHPELRRAAEHLGRPTSQTCPICEDAIVVHVTYAFGPHLPKSGYVIEDRADFNKVRRTTTDGTGYVIEVCHACGWNFMAQSFPIEGRRRT